ncbi:phage holin family protein [Nitrosovibrio sp. Nv6]|uniref:phage holin family protein n=1 Tax=Nitrosovibrio sp. Nv6 TaxID=1855340 RepID=UPI0008C9FF61|nr:phage holin family protein [Nitrosovibrio sp. Nv6]SEO36404.1 putative membrane protein [Nitrosovibrio sp. Nv6]
MLDSIMAFLAHWGITALSLWVASFIFHGISFTNKKSLLISALLLGFANAVIRPVIIILTIPLTLISFGFFLLVINALMLLLVSTLVPGFRISGFWTAFFASIVITILGIFAGMLIFQSEENLLNTPPAHQGVMV